MNTHTSTIQTDHAKPIHIGHHLRDWRQRRHLSQLDLAGDAEISARHLSFLETGRSSPSREMILRLAEQLEIPMRERNVLLVAAGFAPIFPERALSDPALYRLDPKDSWKRLKPRTTNKRFLAMLASLAEWREREAQARDIPRGRVLKDEALTEIAHSHAPDDVYERARKHFSKAELVNLTTAIVSINGWNRIAIAFRMVPGAYQPTKR